MKYPCCGQYILRMGVEAKWPGVNPRLPWNVDLTGYLGQIPKSALLAAFAQAWQWWADAVDMTPIMVQSPGEALIRKHFARIDGSGGVLAWSELADNTNQPKTQRYDAGDSWIVTEGTMSGGIDIMRVACHEIGHVLGLEHDNQNSGALMAPYISDDVPKPTSRDISRLIGLGYIKRTTPIPTPVPPGDLPAANVVRFKTPLAAGDYANFSLGSTVGIGDYMLLLGGDGPPPPVPDEPTSRRRLQRLVALARAEGREDAAKKIEQAVGILPIIQIVIALMPFILAMFNGEPIDWTALIQIILGLFTAAGIPIPT